MGTAWGRSALGWLTASVLVVGAACCGATQAPAASKAPAASSAPAAAATQAPTPAPPAYPTAPVNFVVGWAAGSASDIATRALAESSQKYLGQPIVVQNVPGAGSAIGATQVAKSKPDGYNVLFTAFGILTQPHIEQVTYKPLEDFIPIIQVGGYAEVLVVRPESPFKTAKDIVEFGKANPGKIKWATSGVGSAPDLAGLLLAKAGGFQATPIPFTSGAEGVAAALGGNVDAAFSTTGATIQLIKDGKLRALGITMAAREPAAADIPTFKEQGYDVQLLGWWSLAVAKGTPAAVVQTIHDAVRKGLADDPYKAVMAKALQPIIYLGTADTAAKWKAEYETFGTLLRASTK